MIYCMWYMVSLERICHLLTFSMCLYVLYCNVTHCVCDCPGTFFSESTQLFHVILLMRFFFVVFSLILARMLTNYQFGHS